MRMCDGCQVVEYSFASQRVNYPLSIYSINAQCKECRISLSYRLEQTTGSWMLAWYECGWEDFTCFVDVVWWKLLSVGGLLLPHLWFNIPNKKRLLVKMRGVLGSVWMRSFALGAVDNASSFSHKPLWLPLQLGLHLGVNRPHQIYQVNKTRTNANV